jgi:hypothetical protein
MSERSATASHAEKLRRASERFNEDVADLLFEESLKACRRAGHDDLELGYDAVNHLETLTCPRCETRFVEEV